MAFQLSPGVDVKEIDLTAIIPAVSTTKAGFAGLFNWGPVEQRITVTSVNDLVERFNNPDNVNYSYWFTAANYLGYSNNLQVVRVVDQDTAKNASTNGGFFVKNDEHFEEVDSTATAANHEFIGKYCGTLGNSLFVSVSDRTEQSLNPVIAFPSTSTGFTITNTSGPTTSSTAFGFITTNLPSGIVANSDKLRFKRGEPRTITGVTNAVSFGKFESSGAGATVAALGKAVTRAAGATFNITLTTAGSTAGLEPGGYLTFTNSSGVVGVAKISAMSNAAAGVTCQVTTGASGFGFAGDSTTFTTDSEFITLGQVTAGGFTFADATSGLTAASVRWKYAEEFDQKLPATSSSVEAHGASFDLLHAIVIDEDGDWTGTKGTVLERFPSLSKAKNAKRANGSSIYYKDFINANSEYVFSADDPGFATHVAGTFAFGDDSTSSGGTFAKLSQNYYESLSGGTSSAPAQNDFYENGYELFADSETVDISLILGGPTEGIQAKKLVDLVTARKDAVVFLSPPSNAVVNSTGNASKSAAVATANVAAYRQGLNGADAGGDVNYTNDNLNVSSSYAVLDSGYKYMFDQFNDVFRFVPLNGDIAGIAVRSDLETETWFSPAGFNRGQVRGVVKLAYNPLKAQRDELYINGINPVVSFPGEGTVLFGDKTLLSKPSAFDRINVRRLFIVLEKAIATAAKFQLFEQNDAFTRASFRQLIEPFLRDVQSRRGIIDFKVVCDESNNTGEVIDRNEFVADIFIKPTRSINFISLNFIATRTGIDFDEIGGSSA
tara:strand:- start:6824 stop:9157 length:2334 start_codon:yes stop_codon:yes gene_type:complete